MKGPKTKKPMQKILTGNFLIRLRKRIKIVAIENCNSSITILYFFEWSTDFETHFANTDSELRRSFVDWHTFICV